MALVDLVVAVRADHEEMLDLRLGQELLEELERGRIRPLQVIEEDDERVLLGGDGAAELPEREVEAGLRLGRAERLDARAGGRGGARARG